MLKIHSEEELSGNLDYLSILAKEKTKLIEAYRTARNKHFGGSLPEEPSPEWDGEKLKKYKELLEMKKEAYDFSDIYELMGKIEEQESIRPEDKPGTFLE